MEENQKQTEINDVKSLLDHQKILQKQRDILLEQWKRLIYQQKALLSKSPTLKERVRNEQITA